MACITPLTLVRKYRTIKGDFTDIVPCGKCPQCLARRANSWIFRLKQEQKISDTSAFLTMTYDDENLNWSENGYPTLVKKDHQNFMKRLRKQITKYQLVIPKIRYYSVGEYGTTTHRPHMHSIMFDLPKIYLEHPDHLAKIWSHGHVRIDDCNGATIAYVTKYVMKQMKLDGIDELDDRQPEFSLMSKKMGINYLTDNVKAFYQRKKIPYLLLEDGQKMAMPRYFKDKMYTKLEMQKMAQQSLEYAEKQDLFENPEHELQWKFDQYRKQKKQVNLTRKTI